MNKVFIDTGAFYARYVEKDSYHDKSLELWKQISAKKIPCVTTNFVLQELITLFIYRFGSQQALKASREIYGSQAIQTYSVSHEQELMALEWMERFSDQRFSMTDATSFALMESQEIKTAFSFDHHFEIAGFNLFGS